MSETVAPSPKGSNVPEYTVSEISGAVKRTLESNFGRVRVRGEVTECRPYGTNRFYFSLKDEGGQLRAVIWAWGAGRSGVKPENGTEVIATGKLTAYGDRSSYQIVVDRLDYAGEGALLARIERLRRTLEAEGLFSLERKRALPELPRVIGVVTSAQGAVLQDIRTTILRRFPSRILLWPVAVQGTDAPEQIAAAIEGLDSLPTSFPRPDVIIVARGGGSLEDLMAFNEEVVVRAAAACHIPLISAVGHETDTTLIDFASDQRAPTPTAAAELAVPARAELLAGVQQRAMRLTRAGQSVLERARFRLARVGAALPDLPGMLLNSRQRLDERGQRLALAPRRLLGDHRAALGATAGRLPNPREALRRNRAALLLIETRVRATVGRALDRAGRGLARVPEPATRLVFRLREGRMCLDGMSARLEGASYAGLLSRGFALVRDLSGKPVTRASDVAPGARLLVEFVDGRVEVVDTRGRRRTTSVQGELL